MTRRDYNAVADEVLPVDGPYEPEALQAAASLIAELVRRLNHATRAGTAGIGYPSHVGDVAARIQSAVAVMPQLLMQLADRLTEFVDNPRLYADEWAGGVPAREVAVEAVAELLDAACHVDAAGGAVGRACEGTARLGIGEVP